MGHKPSKRFSNINSAFRSREAHTRELLEVCRNRREHYTWVDEFGVLALESGEHKLTAELQWIQLTIEKLSNPPLESGIDERDLSKTEQERRAQALRKNEEEWKIDE